MTANKIDKIIVTLIKSQKISEQSQLLDLLKSQGIDIIQSSISRRLKKLNIIKNNGFYVINEINNILKYTIAEPNLIIIHTSPGIASSIAYKLDNYLQHKQSITKGILATIAGDDTVLVVIDIKFSLVNTLQNIKDLLINN
jgi:transcriptional regulator of arginine metabolism